MKQTVYLLFIFATAFAFASCNSYKKISYLEDVDQLSMEQLAQNKAISTVIKPGDILTINVNTVNPLAAVPFNLPLVPVVDNGVGGIRNTVGAQSFMVDGNGVIDFPVIGKITIAGMKRIEAEEYIKTAIYPKYITETPIVNVRFMGFPIYVMGEVARPGVVHFSKDRVNLFEALASSGDLTIYGKRRNVLLRREHPDGSSELVRLNLQDKDLLLSPYFYLQQNDIIYVQPNKAKGNSSSIGATENITISVVSILVSVATLLITVFKN